MPSTRGETREAAGDSSERPKSPFALYIGLPVCIAALVHLLGRIGYRGEYVSIYTADALTLAGIMLMLLAAVLVMHHVYRLTFITYATFAAALFILAGQVINLMERSPAWGLDQAVSPAFSLRILFKDACFVAGIALLFGSYMMSLFDANRARARLARAYADVERLVEERTARLVEANRNLGQEIRVRRSAEDALRLSEEKFRALVENSADVILRLDTGLCILYANPTLLRAVGRSPEALAGRSVAQVLGPAPTAERWCASARQVIASGKPARLETMSGEGDTLQLLDWSLAPETGADGRPASLLAVARDMTELSKKESQRRALEEQLVQSQKLESVGRLAGGIAHDFNNLLQVICGYLELATADIEGGHRAHGRLRQVDRAARRAKSLVRQLLAFSRRETMQCEHVDLGRLVTDMGRMLRRVLGEQYDISISTPGGQTLVYADAGHLEQVLMNLCVNARDAMPCGGTIRMETRLVRVSEEAAAAYPERRPGEYVETAVSDSGTGMGQEVLSRIFEPFFTTKETGKGTGLGLAVVYGIVRQHNGFVNVESRPGCGSRFSVFLPAAQPGATETTEEPDSTMPPAGNGETVLLAEDDEQVRNLSRNILENAGYAVIEARDGGEALSKIEERIDEIDLFLLDAIMPLKTGREVYEAIVALQPSAKILFVTGHSFNTLSEVNLPKQGCELLHKPLESKELLKKIRAMLDA